MQKFYKSRKVKFLSAALLLSGAAIDASAYNMQMQENGRGGYGSSTYQEYSLYLYEDDTNTEAYVSISRTRESDEEWGRFTIDDIWIRTIGNNDYYVELPDEITFEFEEESYTTLVNKLGTENEHGYFGGGWEGRTLVIPSNYTHILIDGSFDGVILEIHSATPPVIYGIDNEQVLVEWDSLSAYKDAIANETNGWNSTITVMPLSVPDDVDITINVPSTGQFESTLLANENVNGDPTNVYRLKVTGEINSRDLIYLENLTYLINLDLSDVTIVADEPMMRGCSGLKFLQTVKIPESVTVIGANAFETCYRLKEINLGNITDIRANAFNYCQSLETADLSKVTNIGEYAFNNCIKIDNIDLSSVEYIKNDAFNNCRLLSSINLNNCKRIESYGFHDCYALSEVSTSRNLEFIGWDAFENTALKEFYVFKETYLDGDNFWNSNIENIYLESNSSIGYYSLRGMSNLKNVYCYDPFPYNEEFRLESEAGNRPTIYVPAFALDKYDNNEYYFEFGHVEPLPEDLTYLNVRKDLDIDTTDGLSSKFDMVINTQGTFRNNTDNSLEIGSYVQNGYYYQNWNDGFSQQLPTTSSFISNGPATADSVNVKLDFNGYGNWNFISFPFDVKVGDIITPDNALWVVRKYNGETRANRDSSDESAWENLTNDSTMYAGHGYILHFTPNDYWDYTFDFPATYETRNNLFRNNDVEQQLAYHESIYAHNASWNLIGNPYPAYYNIKAIDYDGPITVWRYVNGYHTYEALNLSDDNYVLLPFEAFFVQGRESADESKIKFGADGRYPNYDEANEASNTNVSRRPAANSTRSIFNVLLTGEMGADRTRLVVNEDASEEYELNCDASKFISTSAEAPQIYMLENNMRMSINERPLGTGVFPLGVKIGVEGVYTISANTRNANEYSIILRDNLTGSETEISEKEYSFSASVGYDNSRFSIAVVARPASVEGIEDAKASVSVNGNTLSVASAGKIAVYSIDGSVVAEAEGSLETELVGGLYVVKTAENTTKVFVGK